MCLCLGYSGMGDVGGEWVGGLGRVLGPRYGRVWCGYACVSVNSLCRWQVQIS